MSLKTLCLRIPASPSLARCCPRTSLPPSNVAARAQPSALTLSRPFARANHSLSSSRQGALSASSPRPSIASLVASRTSSSSSSSSSPTIISYSSSSSSSSSSSLRARPYSSSTNAKSSSDPASAKLDWNSFFKLRLRRRRIQLLFSVITGLAGGAAGTVVLAEGFAEPLIAQVPLDPFFTLGIMTMACAGLGWLIGPTIGNQVFYLVNHRFKTQMLQKEAEFFARIKRHRADPTNSSAGNPVPDFYGEKIQSVAGYRRWLKDQRAFNKKKSASFV
ncbi:hypothetical protein A9Z42_0062870 [Trichoderma parareesei]|uniref:Presequence translocated-associated motor subunit PAM17 n=3 Tax=Trichoderma TaxID=5543 RepID=A0A2H2ZYE9_TRIPA|nr:hypothetical protein A9Z42_0062870 [Trichoderma parareesei]